MSCLIEVGGKRDNQGQRGSKGYVDHSQSCCFLYRSLSQSCKISKLPFDDHF